METAMDEPKNKRLKYEEDYSAESLHLLTIFPDLIWRLILGKLNKSADYFKLCQSFPDSHNLFSGYRTKVLFDDVIKIVVQRLENRQKQGVQLPELVSLRCVCKSWKRGVDANLQNLSSNFKFSTEYKLPRSQFEKNLDKKYAYRFLQVDDYENFLSHFEDSHGITDANPFITRRIIVSILLNKGMAIQPQLDPLESSCNDVLRKFGKHIWYLHFETELSRNWYSPNVSCIFNLLKKILHHLPNLRVLKIDPAINVTAQHEVNSFLDIPSSVRVPLIPGVRTYDLYDGSGRYPASRPEPLVTPRLQFGAFPQRSIQINFPNLPIQVPIQLEQLPNQPDLEIIRGPLLSRPVIQIPTNPPAQPGPIIPVGDNILQAHGRGPVVMAGLPNPPAPVFDNPETDEIPQIPLLSQLRFVHQGKMCFDNFMQIIRPNVQNLTQIGVVFTSNEECKQLFNLPLNLTKLEIDFSQLDMPWFEMFLLLENRFGQSLEHLHIYLPKPVFECQLRLPKLKVLHLLLNDPLPLDSLLGMAHSLEELYVKIGRMNQEESVKVQREERRVVFYKHLGQLTNSNIWTEFPNLKKVRVCAHVEVENMTLFWQCTVEEWRNQNA